MILVRQRRAVYTAGRASGVETFIARTPRFVVKIQQRYTKLDHKHFSPCAPAEARR